jgi:DnaJ-class molecular chaperone
VAIQKAYGILSDPDMRMVYDIAGIDAVEQVKNILIFGFFFVVH